LPAIKVTLITNEVSFGSLRVKYTSNGVLGDTVSFATPFWCTLMVWILQLITQHTKGMCSLGNALQNVGFQHVGTKNLFVNKLENCDVKGDSRGKINIF
jgi:hypothetical protein